MWLFDTSFIINLFEHRKNALAKAEEVDLSPARKHISIITVHEVLRGVYYLYQGSTLNKKLNLTEMALGKFTTLPYLHPIAKQAARLDADLAKKGEIISFPDVVIAATALTYDLILVSKDEHFKRIEGLKLEAY
jgi:tRNA(fMet)-specific endonuclease VapC